MDLAPHRVTGGRNQWTDAVFHSLTLLVINELDRNGGTAADQELLDLTGAQRHMMYMQPRDVGSLA